MRWIPFESLMEQTICLDKKNVLTYMLVDDIVASKYLNTIDQHTRREREEQADKIRQMLVMQAIQRIANNNPTGSVH